MVAIRSVVGVRSSARPTSLTVKRFAITTADGQVVRGAVKGSGGPLSSLAQLERLGRLATKGRPLGVYEPERKCVAVLPEFNAWGDGPETIVSLVGATFAEVES